jgi:hypothetical membrane protein
MDIKLVEGFIRPELFILIVFLWCVGLFLKKAPWFTSEWAIPFVLLGMSFVITVFYIAFVLKEGFTPVVVVTGIIQAVLIASVTVFGNELIKQVLNKRNDDKEG